MCDDRKLEGVGVLGNVVESIFILDGIPLTLLDPAMYKRD